MVVERDEDARCNPAWHAVVRMIVQEFIEEGKPPPEGPEDSVEVEEVSQEEPRVAVMV